MKKRTLLLLIGILGSAVAHAQGEVVNPAQYRDQLIGLLAADVKKVNAALGPDYKVWRVVSMRPSNGCATACWN
jgi:hypothetical protein